MLARLKTEKTVLAKFFLIFSPKVIFLELTKIGDEILL